MHSRTIELQRHGSSLVWGAVATIVAALGCASGDERTPTAGATIEAALASAVVACAEDLGPCMTGAEGDADAMATCRDNFDACHADAMPPAPVADAHGADAIAIRACTSVAMRCLKDAGGGDAVMVCRDALLACLDEHHPQPEAMPDAGTSGGGAGHAGGEPATAGKSADAPPVGMTPPEETPPPNANEASASDAPPVSCHEQLEACIEAGETAQACASALKGCGDP